MLIVTSQDIKNITLQNNGWNLIDFEVLYPEGFLKIVGVNVVSDSEFQVKFSETGDASLQSKQYQMILLKLPKRFYIKGNANQLISMNLSLSERRFYV